MNAIGQCIDMREDGLDLRPNAQFRALSSGQDLGFHVAVLKIRGGRALLFVKEPIQFLVIGSVIQGMSLGSWVTSEMRLQMIHGENRISWYACMGLHMTEGITPSTLFSCLGVTVGTAIVDWLHAMYQRVLADVTGNALWDALSLLDPPPSKSQSRRCGT